MHTDLDLPQTQVHSERLCHAGTGPGKARSQEVMPGLSRGWQSPNYLNHHPLCLMVCYQEAGIGWSKLNLNSVSSACLQNQIPDRPQCLAPVTPPPPLLA